MGMMEKYLCIHGHFYQPPRENPWLDHIEQQDSAQPYHDWNERITEQCYEPNSAARILDDEGYIQDIVNNYARISFNFGPTLLRWFQRCRPEIHAAILEADRLSQERFSGHGGAMAQAYSHLIMPLANRRDKQTQILWGIRDFRHRFGRAPEGMWLPETAVDLETLQMLATYGIRFTLLAPRQAARVKGLTEKRWQDVRGGRVDPRRPYLCRLPDGQSLTIFFYDGAIAQDVAFSDLLKRGETLADRLTGTLTSSAEPQLAHIATDGETYGHHHLFGEMALAYALRHVDTSRSARVTIYGEYLEKHPPTHEVEIEENSSWSCSHGVERWRSDCGCHTGGKPGWNQQWRRPLREALDWLRDELAVVFEQEGKALLCDPWQSRDHYIDLLLDPAEDRIDLWLDAQAVHRLSVAERSKALALLEMQRHAMLMFTSCGWFFNDISGIETVQILAYASRALQLAEDIGARLLEEAFIQRLGAARSNVAAWQDGGTIYRQAVKPMRVDLARVAAHHAMLSLFQAGADGQMYSYSMQRRQYDEYRAGKMKLACGRVVIRSRATRKEGDFTFHVLYLGGHSLVAGVRSSAEAGETAVAADEVVEAFRQGDIPRVLRLLDHLFPQGTFGLEHLFRDDQRLVMDKILRETLREIETSFQEVHDEHYVLMRFLHGIDMPAPSQLALPVGFVLNRQLRTMLDEEPFEANQFRQTLAEIELLGLALEQPLLDYRAERRLTAELERLPGEEEDPDRLETAVELAACMTRPPLQVDLWKAQNICFGLHRTLTAEMERRAAAGDKKARRWLASFEELAGFLKVRLR